MNEKGTSTEISTHTPLTSVGNGVICRLVGVSEDRSRRIRHGNPRRLFAESGRQHGKFERGKKKFGHDYGRRQIMKRLLDLGLTKGCSFKVIQSRGRGPVLVEVRGTRIALGYGLASQLIVEVLGGTK
ncbi:MAG: ferrous iron transport protein A [Candidatus Thorarchaeota archaeon]